MANRCADGLGTVLRERYPWVKLIEAPPTHNDTPTCAHWLFKRASGDVVAVLEDHCFVEPRIGLRHMIEAHQGEYPVIGGSVENAACERFVDWAAFFCEYSQAMKPMREGEAEDYSREQCLL